MIIVIILIGPCARSDWSKTHVLSESKTWKKRVFFVVVVVVVVVLFCLVFSVIATQRTPLTKQDRH